MKLQWENKLSEIQAKNAHNINSEKEQALKVLYPDLVYLLLV